MAFCMDRAMQDETSSNKKDEDQTVIRNKARLELNVMLRKGPLKEEVYVCSAEGFVDPDPSRKSLPSE
ncbi:hypothetical protein Tco_0738292 [Tanacetum coccineum]